MKKISIYIIAFAFPWIIMLINDKPGAALISLIMQVTIIGWIPAIIWAIKEHKKNYPNHFEKINFRFKRNFINSI